MSGTILSGDDAPLEAVTLVRIETPSADVLGITRGRISKQHGVLRIAVWRSPIGSTRGSDSFELGDYSGIGTEATHWAASSTSRKRRTGRLGRLSLRNSVPNALATDDPTTTAVATSFESSTG